MANQLKSIYKSLKDYTGTATNAAIVAATGGLQQLTSLAAFRCPCVDVKELQPGCVNTTAIGSPTCSQVLNFGYGISFIIAPALALFVFGIAASPKLWKFLTGCKNKTQHLKLEMEPILWTIVMIVGKALLSPLSWVCVALLDGKYLACATSSLPYDVGKPGSTYANCIKVAQVRSPSLSEEFIKNTSFSQILGWIFTGVLVMVGIIIYGATQCNFPLTYYHAKYYRLYREHEEKEFDEEMNNDAQMKAEENVRLFINKPRQKTDWDYISTVYEFHRDKKNLALYSNLDEWAKKQRKNMLLQPKPDNSANGGNEDTASTNV